MQLAVIPEHGAQALVHVDVIKQKPKSEALVFPSFLGKAPKPLLKDESGESTCLQNQALLELNLGSCCSALEKQNALT